MGLAALAGKLLLGLCAFLCLALTLEIFSGAGTAVPWRIVFGTVTGILFTAIFASMFREDARQEQARHEGFKMAQWNQNTRDQEVPRHWRPGSTGTQPFPTPPPDYQPGGYPPNNPRGDMT